MLGYLALFLLTYAVLSVIFGPANSQKSDQKRPRRK